jgi:hypothetical protein
MRSSMPAQPLWRNRNSGSVDTVDLTELVRRFLTDSRGWYFKADALDPGSGLHVM